MLNHKAAAAAAFLCRCLSGQQFVCLAIDCCDARLGGLLPLKRAFVCALPQCQTGAVSTLGCCVVSGRVWIASLCVVSNSCIPQAWHETLLGLLWTFIWSNLVLLCKQYPDTHN